MRIRTAVVVTVAVWAFLFFATWGTWGSVTIDCFRDPYVAEELVKGKTLYLDLWYPYGPGAPYFIALLFRLFGASLAVLYWVGALAGLASALLLMGTGARLGHTGAGLMAGLAQLVWGFKPGVFSFPLPYSFAAAFGCVLACLCCWILPSAIERRRWLAVLSAVAGAGAALKLEFGAALFAGVGLALFARIVSRRSARDLGADLGAILPGVLFAAAVLWWVLSLAGFDFIVEENWQSWPTSYFMRQYGEYWLRSNGAKVDIESFMRQGGRVIAFAAFWGLLAWYWRRLDAEGRLSLGRMIVPIAVLTALYVPFRGDGLNAGNRSIRVLLLPTGTVLMTAAAGVFSGWHWWRHRTGTLGAAKAAGCLVCGLTGLRILMGLTAEGYAVFYAGPAILFLSIWVGERIRVRHAASVVAASFLSILCLSVQPAYRAAPAEALASDRGTIKIHAGSATAYREAIAFIKARSAQGGVVASLPEDMALYFLTGTRAPSRNYVLTPGVLTPGPITDRYVEDLRRAGVTDIVWSNRSFEEYGVPEFGVDFDPAVGEYLRAGYQRSRALARGGTGAWTADVWTKKP